MGNDDIFPSGLAFSEGDAPLRVDITGPETWREANQSCQHGGGPGYPALHAPGLPANNYSEAQQIELSQTGVTKN